jgi:carbohydrate ABC transporter membrane protein 2, CUT1 family (TC 3.A.1.1.-)
MLLVFLFPIYWMVNVSLQPGATAVGASWFPVDPSFDSYASAFADQMPHLVTSLIVAIGAVIVSLSIAVPGAYALARYRVPGASAVLLVILLTQMIPGIVIANALYGAYTDVGLLNSIPGLVLADASLGIPFAILLLQPAMRAIPASIVEAAEVDGAGPFRTFIQIVVPVSRNTIVTAGLFSFLYAWGDFLFALTLTTTENVRPVTLSLYTYLGGHVQDWGSVMATSVMASVPAIFLLLIAQRYISAGISAGSVKS